MSEDHRSAVDVARTPCLSECASSSLSAAICGYLPRSPDLLRPLEAPDEDSFAEDVPVHCLEHIGARGLRRQIELRIECEELPRVVMIGGRQPALPVRGTPQRRRNSSAESSRLRASHLMAHPPATLSRCLEC